MNPSSSVSDLQQPHQSFNPPPCSLVLQGVEKKIYHLGSLENFSKGWEVLEERSGKVELVAYKIGTAVGTICVAGFSVGAVVFGCFAFQEAIQNEYPEEGRAPIIGHFSEWTILGIWSLASWGLVLDNISTLGKSRRIQEIFHKATQKNPGHIEEIYHEYLEKLKVFLSPTYLFLSKIPHPPCDAGSSDIDQSDIDQSDMDLIDAHSNLAQDQALKSHLEAVERELEKLSNWEAMKKGWGVIKRESSSAKMLAIRTSMLAGGLFLGFNLLNYPLGIFWSAEQAVHDGRDGEIPSIGGHSLEWMVEFLGITTFIWYYCGEIGNVGMAELTRKVFQDHAPDAEEQSIEPLERYKTIMKEQIRSIPDGYFFNIPRWFKYD